MAESKAELSLNDFEKLRSLYFSKVNKANQQKDSKAIFSVLQLLLNLYQQHFIRILNNSVNQHQELVENFVIDMVICGQIIQRAKSEKNELRNSYQKAIETLMPQVLKKIESLQKAEIILENAMNALYSYAEICEFMQLNIHLVTAIRDYAANNHPRYQHCFVAPIVFRSQFQEVVKKKEVAAVKAFINEINQRISLVKNFPWLKKNAVESSDYSILLVMKARCLVLNGEIDEAIKVVNSSNHVTCIAERVNVLYDYIESYPENSDVMHRARELIIVFQRYAKIIQKCPEENDKVKQTIMKMVQFFIQRLAHLAKNFKDSYLFNDYWRELQSVVDGMKLLHTYYAKDKQVLELLQKYSSLTTQLRVLNQRLQERYDRVMIAVTIKPPAQAVMKEKKCSSSPKKIAQRESDKKSKRKPKKSNNREILRQQAVVAQQRKDYEQAISLYEESIQNEPELSIKITIMLHIAELYEVKEDMKAAQKYYHNVVGLAEPIIEKSEVTDKEISEVLFCHSLALQKIMISDDEYSDSEIDEIEHLANVREKSMVECELSEQEEFGELNHQLPKESYCPSSALEQILVKLPDIEMVGGVVRDMLLGLQPKDVDLSVACNLDEVTEKTGADIIGKRFPIVRVIRKREVFEISSSNGDAIEDSLRRDFTINTLRLNPNTLIISDYCGGMQDLQNKVIRTVIDADKSFAQDPARMLRAIRLQSQLADLGFTLDEKCAAGINNLAAKVTELNPNRLFYECYRLFFEGHAKRNLVALEKFGLLDKLLPDVASLIKNDLLWQMRINKMLSSIDTMIKAKVPVSPSVMFAALLWQPLQQKGKHETAFEAEKIMDSLLSQLPFCLPPKIYSTIKRIWFRVEPFSRYPSPVTMREKDSVKTEYFLKIISDLVNSYSDRLQYASSSEHGEQSTQARNQHSILLQ